MIRTNSMLNSKQQKNQSIPEMNYIEGDLDDPFFQKNLNVSFFTDIIDLQSTNISAIIERPERDFLGLIKGGIN